MAAAGGARSGRRLWVDCGPRRVQALRDEPHGLEILVWRLAVGWGGRSTGAAGWVLPLAVVERRGGRTRWRPVPDLTLAAQALGLAAAAWVALRPRRARAARQRGG